MNQKIDGVLYKRMLINAAAMVDAKKQSLNDLNVFPVPDGDTGTNMSMTLSYCARELESMDTSKIGKIAEKSSSALIRGSHGNSGVITSLLFGGMWMMTIFTVAALNCSLSTTLLSHLASFSR